jgi:hypothetical protein
MSGHLMGDPSPSWFPPRNPKKPRPPVGASFLPLGKAREEMSHWGFAQSS